MTDWGGDEIERLREELKEARAELEELKAETPPAEEHPKRRRPKLRLIKGGMVAALALWVSRHWRFAAIPAAAGAAAFVLLAWRQDLGPVAPVVPPVTVVPTAAVSSVPPSAARPPSPGRGLSPRSGTVPPVTPSEGSSTVAGVATTPTRASVTDSLVPVLPSTRLPSVSLPKPSLPTATVPKPTLPKTTLPSPPTGSCPVTVAVTICAPTVK